MFCNVKGIQNLFTICVLIEEILYTVCVLGLPRGIVFGQVCFWPIYGKVILVVSVLPLIPDCTLELQWAEVMKGFKFSVWKLKYDRVFLNYAIHDGEAFIILLRADGPVINN